MKTRSTLDTLRARLLRLQSESNKLTDRIKLVSQQILREERKVMASHANKLAELPVYQDSVDPDVLKVWRNYDVVMTNNGLFSRKLGTDW
jgi:hypothetical protein